MNLSIANITCGLAGLEGDFGDAALDRYAPFLSSTEPELRITVTLDDTLEVVPIGDEDPPLVEISVAEEQPSIVRMHRGDNPFRAWIDQAAGRGELVCGANEYCLDSFLRVLYSVLIASRGGALLHTAAVGPGAGEGVDLLLGQSESGKTTASRQGFTSILGDELVAVTPDGTGFVAWGTPFWGEFVAGRTNARERVRRVFLLRKGATEHIREIPHAQAALEILGCTFFFGPPEYAPNQLALVSSLVEDAFVGELHCTPTPAIVEFLCAQEEEEVRCV